MNKAQSYSSSILSEESDLASDIEADLQGLSIKDYDNYDQLFFSTSDRISVDSNFAPSAFSSTSDLIGATSSDDAMTSTKQYASSYLKMAGLRSIFTQLLNSQLKNSCGSPCCISLQTFIIIGTTNGYIFIFDRNQVLRLCLNTATGEGAEQGPLTSLSQNLSSTRLLAGYASGRLIMWQLPSLSLQTWDPSTESSLVGSDDSLPETTGFSANMDTERRKNKKRGMGEGNLLRVIDDAHQKGQSVTLCAFTSLSTLAVSVDSGGSVYQLAFKRGIFGRSTKSVCFFSGSHGEICAIEPLRPSSTTSVMVESIQLNSASRFLYKSAMVVMASFTKVIVVVFQPNFRVVFWQHLKGQPSCLPILAWNWHSCSSSRNSAEAFLAFARTSTVNIARLYVCPQESRTEEKKLSYPDSVGTGLDAAFVSKNNFVFQFDVVRSISFEFRLVSLRFLSTDYLTVLDSDEVLHLIDILSSGNVVELHSLSSLQLYYNSSTFKALAIGGTVSEALACASERACTNSIVSTGGQILVLGKTGLFLFVLREWKERAKSLIKLGRIEEAIKTCLQVVASSPFPSSQSESVQELLRAAVFFRPSHGSPTERLSAISINFMVRLCLLTDNWDFMHSSLVLCLRDDALTFPLFLRCLTVHISSLSPIYLANHEDNNCFRNLPPDLVLELLAWCVVRNVPGYQCDSSSQKSVHVSLVSSLQQDEASPRTLEHGRALAESCLMRLAPSSLDIDKVVKFCLANRMYQGFIYIYCFILRDHEWAFRWLTDLLLRRHRNGLQQKEQNSSCLHSDILIEGTDLENTFEITEIINVTLLFLRATFSGEESFGVPLPSDIAEEVPNNIFNLLLSSTVSSLEKTSECLYLKPLQPRYPPVSPSFPRLRVLLHFGLVDLVNMLTLVLREAFFYSSHQSTICLSRRQRLFNALSHCILDSGDEAGEPFEAFTVGRVLCFLGQQLLAHENDSIVFEKQKLVEILQKLVQLIVSSSSVRSLPSDLSDVLFNLFSACHLPVTNSLLQLCQEAGLDDFCEQVYRRQGNPVAVLGCLLSTLKREDQRIIYESTSPMSEELVFRVFGFVYAYFCDSNCNQTLRLSLTNEIIKSVELLARVSPLRCLILLMQCLGPSMRHILGVLDSIWLQNASISADLLSISDDSQMLLPSLDGPHHPACIILLDAYYELRNSETFDLDRDLALSGISTFSGGDPSMRMDFETIFSRSDPVVAECFICLLKTQQSCDRKKLRLFLATNDEYRANIIQEMLDERAYSLELACIYEKIGDISKASDLLQKVNWSTHDAIAYTFEICGDDMSSYFLNAFNSMIREQTMAKVRNEFLSRWNSLVDCCRADPLATEPSPATEHPNFSVRSSLLHSCANILFQFSVRRCSDKRESENEASWFAVIDLLSELRKQHHSDLLAIELNAMFQKLLETASPYVRIPSLINRVLHLADTSVALFGSATNLFLMQLVGVCKKEFALSQVCHSLMRADIRDHESKLGVDVNQGVGLRRYTCSLCGLTLSESYKQIRSRVTCQLHTGGFTTIDHHHDQFQRHSSITDLLMFWCGHCVHFDCLEDFTRQQKIGNASISKMARYSCPACSYNSMKTLLKWRNDTQSLNNCFVGSKEQFTDFMTDFIDEIQITSPRIASNDVK